MISYNLIVIHRIFEFPAIDLEFFRSANRYSEAALNFEIRASSRMAGVGARHLEGWRRVAILKNPSDLCAAIGGGRSVVNAVHLGREICHKWANIPEHRGPAPLTLYVRAAHLAFVSRDTARNGDVVLVVAIVVEIVAAVAVVVAATVIAASSTPKGAYNRSLLADLPWWGCALCDRDRDRTPSEQSEYWSTVCTPWERERDKERGEERRSTVSIVERCGVGDRAPVGTVYSSERASRACRARPRGSISSPSSSPSSSSTPARSRVAVVQREKSTSERAVMGERNVHALAAWAASSRPTSDERGTWRNRVRDIVGWEENEKESRRLISTRDEQGGRTCARTNGGPVILNGRRGRFLGYWRTRRKARARERRGERHGEVKETAIGRGKVAKKERK